MAMANDLTLWGVGTSRTMRAHWMLLELGLDYQFHPIGSRAGETRTDELKRLNPRYKLPELQHRSCVVTCRDWAASERISLSEPALRYRERVALRPAYQGALARNFAARKA